MPIKEFIAVAAALMASIIATHPTHPLEAVREIQAKILRDVGRTDNWYDCRQAMFGGCRFYYPSGSHSPRKLFPRRLKTVPRT
jgi:hypothetical protein